jgi:Zn-dependent protease with chaperone function
MTAGRYFDGSSTRGQDVQVEVQAGALQIDGINISRRVAGPDVTVSLSSGRAPARFALNDGCHCEISEPKAAAELALALGKRPGLVERMQTHPVAVVSTLLAFVCLVVAIWQWGIPLASDFIAARVPASWEVSLGKSVLDQLDQGGIFRPSNLPAKRQDFLRASFQALVKPADAPRYRIEFRALGTPNAFALPGGTIVVSDELVALADHDDQALMTILGHELGHIQYRHATRALVRSALLSAFAAWYFGDVSSFAAGAAASLTSLKHSRAAESEADLYALSLMRNNAIPTQGAALLLQKLANWPTNSKTHRTPSKYTMQFPEYLSTHPDIQGRIALFGKVGER